MFYEAYPPDHCGYDDVVFEQLWIPIDVGTYFLRPRSMRLLQ